jgi:hypothetical protein
MRRRARTPPSPRRLDDALLITELSRLGRLGAQQHDVELRYDEAVADGADRLGFQKSRSAYKC